MAFPTKKFDLKSDLMLKNMQYEARQMKIWQTDAGYVRRGRFGGVEERNLDSGSSAFHLDKLSETKQSVTSSSAKSSKSMSQKDTSLTLSNHFDESFIRISPNGLFISSAAGSRCCREIAEFMFGILFIFGVGSLDGRCWSFMGLFAKSLRLRPLLCLLAPRYSRFIR
jgi:hypothetical protein